MDLDLFKRCKILIFCSLLYLSFDAKTDSEENEDKNDLSDEEINLMIMYIRDGPPVNIFWINNETLETTLLTDEKRLLKADEAFVATHKEQSDVQGITWHVYALFGRCAFAIPRMQAIGIAASIFDKLRVEPNAVLRRVFEWDKSTTVGGVIAIFPHLNPSKQCNLYVVEANKEGSSSVQKVSCDTLKPLRPRPVIGWANDFVGDGYIPECFCFAHLNLRPLAAIFLFKWESPRRKNGRLIHNKPHRIKPSPSEEEAPLFNPIGFTLRLFGSKGGYNGVRRGGCSGGYKGGHKRGHSPRKPAPIETKRLDYPIRNYGIRI